MAQTRCALPSCHARRPQIPNVVRLRPAPARRREAVTRRETDKMALEDEVPQERLISLQDKTEAKARLIA